MEQTLKPTVKHSRGREPLSFAFFGLALFMVVYFGRPEEWIPGLRAVPLAKIAGVLMLLALVFSLRNIHWHTPREVIFLILLVAQLWLAAIFSTVWKAGAISVMLDFSKVLPLVIVIYSVIRSMKRLRWILFVQAASVAAVAIVSALNQHILGGRLQGALVGMYANPNDLALFIAVSLPLCLVLGFTTKSYWNKIAWTFAMLAMVYVVVLTASRGGAIALVVAALVCLWQLGVKSRRFYLLLLVPVALVVFWLYSGNTLRERFDQTNVDAKTTDASAEASGSAQQRKDLLIQSLKITAQHPFFGVGPGNFIVVSRVWRVTHNSYTQISAEGGIPSFFLYMFVLWCSVANLRDVDRYSGKWKGIQLLSMALRASLAAFLAGSFFSSVAYSFLPYCLVVYTSSLRLILQMERVVSRGAPKTELEPAEVEATASA